jgi:hypothetical protein
MPPSNNDNKKQKPSGSFLPEAVAAKYEPVEGVLQHFVCAEFGRVDLTQIDLQLAEQLAEKGYLKKLS